jgi:hypothetical protein
MLLLWAFLITSKKNMFARRHEILKQGAGAIQPEDQY